jgi:trehalose 6-phosphate phosphatase
MGSSGPGGPDRQATSRPDVFDKLDELRTRIDRVASLLLLLDFDGTLAPIVPRPVLAALPESARQVLNELAVLSDVTTAIVSGRALEDVRQRVGIHGLIYAGNHGLEIEGCGLLFKHPRAVELISTVRKVSSTIRARASAFEGVEVEDKVLTTSVHHRRTSPRERVELTRLVGDLVPPDDPHIEVREGKMVHEIRPRVDWDKGNAVAWIQNQLGLAKALKVVAGDDMTDESAFLAFDDAITICVDPRRPTAASYRARDPEDVCALLAWIARTWKDAQWRRGR